MDSPVIVGPVRTNEEAQRYLKKGADAISLLIEPHPNFAEHRVISIEAAHQLRAVLAGIPVGVIVSRSKDFAGHVQMLRDLQPDFVDMHKGLINADLRREVLTTIDFEWLMSGVWMDYDEDPSWLAASLDDVIKLESVHPQRFIVSLLPSLKNGLRFLRFEAGEFEEDLVLEDIIQLTKNFPVMVNVGPEEVDLYDWFFLALPINTGLAIYLSEHTTMEAGSPITVTPECGLEMLERWVKRKRKI